MGFSNGMKSVKSNLRLKSRRNFLSKNRYSSKGSIIGSKMPRKKYQSFMDKLAILILHKLGYKGVV